MQSFFQAPEPFCTSFLFLSYERREWSCGEAVALVWDTGEMKDKKKKKREEQEPYTAWEHGISASSSEMGPILGLYEHSAKVSSDQRDWNRWARRKAVASQAKIQTMIK